MDELDDRSDDTLFLNEHEDEVEVEVEEEQEEIKKISNIHLKMGSFKRFTMTMSKKLFKNNSGIVELLTSLDFAFKQVTFLLKNTTNLITKKSTTIEEQSIRLAENIECTFINALMTTNCVKYIISSTRTDVISIQAWRQGDYILAIDPIDGVQNFSSFQPMGTTFGIYCSKSCTNDYKDLLDSCGAETLVASGYTIYGISTVLNITFKNVPTVWEFFYDTIFGEFVLLNDNVRIPTEGNLFCVDLLLKRSGNMNSIISSFINSSGGVTKNIGSFTTNFHFVLKSGGLVFGLASQLFPKGKFQILTKLNPLSLICENAGGYSFGGSLLTNLTQIRIQNLHQTAQSVMGSVNQLLMWTSYFKNSQYPEKRSSKVHN